MVIFLFAAAHAQDGTIKGKLTDSETGEPLPGANVLILELNQGAATNAQGAYSLEEVPAGNYTLQVTFVGYNQKSMPVSVEAGETVTKNIALLPSTVGLEDVVVTAFGVEREQRSMGVAQQSVSSEDMAANRETNFVNSLQGKVAGVQITNATGAVGGSSRIVLRGVSSLSGNNQPLFVVDGVYIDNSNLDPATEFGGEADFGNAAMDINPNNIKSITVLKGPNAAALYGSRAANGAIIIETKDGTGQAQQGLGIQVNSSVTFQDVLVLPDMQNQYGQGNNGQFEYVDGAGGGLNDGVDESWGPPLNGQPKVQWWTNGETAPWVAHPDNVENYFELGSTISNNIAVSGNFGDTNYRLSVTNMQQSGTIPNSTLERNNVTFNAGAELTDDFRVDGKVTYINLVGKNRPAQGYASGNPMQQLTQWFGRQVDVEKLEDYKFDDGTPRNWNYNYHDNVYWMQHENGNRQDRNRIIGNISFNYDLNDWISLTGRTGTDWYEDRRQGWNAVYTLNDPDGYFEEDVYYVREWTSNLIVKARRDITDNISFDGRFGVENRQRDYRRNFASAPGLSIPGVYSVENSSVRQNLVDRTRQKEVNSAFGAITLGYQDFVYLDITGRNDWSSTLPMDNNSFFYPSASLSFIFSDAFDLNAPWLTYGKVRASWSEVGNDTDPYQLQAVYTSQSPYGNIPTYTVDNRIPNNNLKPEQTESIEVGTELRFLDNRLGLDVTYYTQSTTNQILPVQISRASGYVEQVINAGEIENSGVEVMLNATPVQTRDFQWDLTANFAKNNNEVVALTEDLDSYILETTWDVSVEARPGEEFGSLYGNPWVRDDAGNIVVDGNGLPILSSEQKNFGSYQPDWTGSLQNTFSYKNLSLSFLIDTKQGGVLSSVTNMFGRYTGILEETLQGRDESFVFDGGRWADGAVKQNGEPNDIKVGAGTPISAETFNKASSYGHAESHIFDASYIKLRELRLSYNLPPSLLETLPFRNVQVAFVGRNLWIIDKEAPHIDPETAFNTNNTQGLESNQIPSARSFGFNINFSL